MPRPLRYLSGAVLVIAVALGGGLLFRQALTEAFIERWLAARGLGDSAVEVTALDLRGARLEGIHLGAQDELTADALEISYDLSALDLGAPLTAIDEVTLDGLVLRLDLTGQGPPLGSLQSLLEGDGGAEPAGSLSVPPINLRNARLEADTPLGTVSTTLDGTLAPSSEGKLAASLALNAEGRPGRIAGTFFAEASADGMASGSLVLDDGSLSVAPIDGQPAVAIEGLSGALAFSLERWQPVSLTGDFAIAGLQHPGGVAGRASLSFDVTPGKVSGETSFTAADGRAEGSATVSLQDYATQPKIEARLTADAEAGTELLGLLPLPRATAGRGRLALRLTGQLAPFDRFGRAQPGALPAPPSLQPLVAWLGEGDVALETRVGLDEVALPDRARGVTASLAATLAMTGNRLSVGLLEDAHLAAVNLAPDWLAALGVAPDLAEALQDGGTLTLTAADEPVPLLHLEASEDDLSLQIAGAADVTWAEQEAASLTLDAALSGTPEAFAGTADVSARASRLESGDARIAEPEIRLPLAVERTAERLRLSLTAPGRLAAARVERDGLETIRPAAALESGWMAMTLTDGAGAFEHEIEVRPEPFRLSVAGAQGPIELSLGPLTLSGRATADAPYAGQAVLASGSVGLDALAVTVDALSGQAQYDAGFTQATADFAATVSKHDDALPLVPLVLTGKLSREGPAVRLTAEARPESATPELAALRLPIGARYDLDKGRGEVSLQETSFLFAPGGLQPRHLLPALVDLANVSGEARLAATLGLGTAASDTKAEIALQDLSFRSGRNQVNGLNLEMTLDSLQPPASPPGQRLTIARLDSLLPVEDIEATFQLPAADEPQVKLERLGFQLAGGQFEARDSLLVLGAERQAIAFDVTGLELAPLFEALSVSGLTGSGTLDGRIPLALVGEQVAVEGGHLESQAPGTLAYSSPSLKSSLPPDADDLDLLKSPVDLAILALGNFRYDTLTLDLDKAAAGETHLKLHVEGKNPELLDGYPFVFNINLKGNLNPLIAALRQGTGLTDEMIRRTWKATP